MKSPDKYPLLSPRELEILQYIVDTGWNKRKVAADLCISIHTMKAHLCNIYQKLEVTGLTEAVVQAIKLDMITVKKVEVFKRNRIPRPEIERYASDALARCLQITPKLNGQFMDENIRQLLPYKGKDHSTVIFELCSYIKQQEDYGAAHQDTSASV